MLQIPWEIEWLEHFVVTMNCDKILEIGAWEGGTLAIWLEAASEVVVIDDEMRKKDQWLSWADDQPVDLILIKGKSQDVGVMAQAVEHGEYDFVFIDSDHSYEAAKADFDAYFQLVRPGGMLAFHDIRGYAHSQIDILWAEIKKSYKTIEIQHPVEEWGGIGIVFKP